jgi:hypothetical protein
LIGAGEGFWATAEVLDPPNKFFAIFCFAFSSGAINFLTYFFYLAGSFAAEVTKELLFIFG